MEQTPYLSLASGYYYRYAWPWVMNYYGEHNVSYWGNGSWIYATLWLDQGIKAEMGY